MKNKNLNFHIGCSGWNYSEWKNDFYKGIPSKKKFEHYTHIFDTVEINNTFYKFPELKIIKKWKNEAPPNFIFSIKAHRVLTHSKEKFENKEKLKTFYNIISNLQEKLGVILFQFPGNVKYNEKLLNTIVENIDYSFKNVIEFRDTSWCKENVFRIFSDNKIIFCNVSSPILGIENGIQGTREDVFVRFHGVEAWYNHNYSLEELEKWAKALQKFRTQNIWAYFNNTNFGDAPRNAVLFKSLLHKGDISN